MNRNHEKHKKVKQDKKSTFHNNHAGAADNSRPSLLQEDMLNNEVIVTDPKKIFNNSVYIEKPDSLAQSGLTDISYEVLLNSARVLSIKFDLESMGAYPENYKRYYCFDA